MKLIHLSDLHLGKRVNEFSMLEDQAYILMKILNVIDDEQPDAVLIAGDVYDKTVPSAEAVELFDDFLVRLASRSFRGRSLQIFVISGNHDSPERIAFGSRLLDRSGVHLSPVYHGDVEPVVLEDQFGPVCIYMLPFIKPTHVRRYYPDEGIETYSEAVRTAVAKMGVDRSVRNVLVTHQFVTGATRSESEEISVGGSDNVDAQAFDDFDYVALGHIHGPQDIDSPKIRYCGTPLKYSFSEAEHIKSVTVAELEEKGTLHVRTVPLVPKHDMRVLQGSYMELTARPNYIGTAVDDYLHIILTDEEEIPEAMNRLRVIYPNVMKLSYDNRRTRSLNTVGGAEEVERKSPLELFEELYEKQNGTPLSEEQTAYVMALMENIWEERT